MSGSFSWVRGLVFLNGSDKCAFLSPWSSTFLNWHCHIRFPVELPFASVVIAHWRGVRCLTRLIQFSGLGWFSLVSVWDDIFWRGGDLSLRKRFGEILIWFYLAWAYIHLKFFSVYHSWLWNREYSEELFINPNCFGPYTLCSEESGWRIYCMCVMYRAFLQKVM